MIEVRLTPIEMTLMPASNNYLYLNLAGHPVLSNFWVNSRRIAIEVSGNPAIRIERDGPGTRNRHDFTIAYVVDTSTDKQAVEFK